jgi:Photosynthesis system II assembly factor YCF48
MAREDRERNFEKALARNLRPDPPADAQTHACPDAELLSAYHERSLPPEQMISWKEHIASCSRCQEVLAHLEATDEIPLDANQEKYEGYEVPVVSQPDLPVLTLAVAHPSAPAAMPASVDKSRERRRKLLRPANWRWLAPAGAIAAILILWVAFRENTSSRVEVAKNQPTSVAVPVPPSPSPSASQSESPEPKQEPNLDAKQQATPRSPSLTFSQPSAAPAEKKPTPDENFQATLKQETPAAPTDKTKADREQFAQKSLPLNGRSAQDLKALSAGRFDAKKDAGELSKQSVALGGTFTQIAPPPVSGVAGAATNSPAPAAHAAAPGTAKEPPLPAAVTESVEVTNPNQTVMVEPQAQVVDGVSRSSTTAEMVRLARGQIPVTVNTPNQNVLWRIEAAGIVQRSTDSGSTWTLQKSGVVTDLTAGSAPSEKVCWIAGRAGTILRTADGGAHWLKVRSPVTDDLSTVFAVDADQATVSATNHKSYKTSDAGRTWTPLPNP